MNEFYLRDEIHRTIGGALVELKGVLYFKQGASGFDNKATSDHVKMCPIQFEYFKRANPDYVLPEAWFDVSIGQPTSALAVAEVAVEASVEEVAPVVEVAPVEVAVVEEVVPTEVPVVDEVVVAPVEEVLADVSGTDF